MTSTDENLCMKTGSSREEWKWMLVLSFIISVNSEKHFYNVTAYEQAISF